MIESWLCVRGAGARREDGPEGVDGGSRFFPLEDADREEQRNVRRSKALLLPLRCTQLWEGYLILQGGDAIRDDG